MHKTLIPFDGIPQLAKTDKAYVSGDAALRPFYQYEPQLAAFQEIIQKRQAFKTPRALLTQALEEQYKALPTHDAVRRQLDALALDDTFTVATAHQPVLFLGPLYFIYKAVTTINLAEAVQGSTGRRIVPVFVLGSEDHDLDELNHINLYNKKLIWLPEEKGAVGSFSTASTDTVLAELRNILGDHEAAQNLFARIETAYKQPSFAQATQALLHDLFGRFGLIVLNMNHPALKRQFIPVMQAELLEQPAFRLVNETLSELNTAGFKTQAAPREINLFYMTPGSRERIVLENGRYKVLNTELEFTDEEILAELNSSPEKFSPNVILRPLFQELILPNLAYVGGGGELAYWLERKSLFGHFQTPYPMLVRRNSALWLDRDALKRLDKLGFSAAQFFEDTENLVRTYVAAHAAGEVSLSGEMQELEGIFERLAQKAQAIDPTLEKAVLADKVKFATQLEQWQSRLVRAEKQKHEVALNQLRALKEKLFPGNGLQERYDNFIPCFLRYGETFLDALKTHLNPFDPGLAVLSED